MSGVSLNCGELIVPLIWELVDKVAYKILLSTAGSEKSIFEIASENELPLSSTYKKSQELRRLGLLSVARVECDVEKRKTSFYISNMKPLPLKLLETRRTWILCNNE